jgi:broad specificity phosphatase PhoE
VNTGEAESSWIGPRLLLLRHGEVVSHKGDMPLTPRGRRQARRAGRDVGASSADVVMLLASPTARTRDTAAEFFQGLREAAPESPVPEPRTSFALRNPDLYLAGHHVNMVSTAAAFCEQAPIVTERQCLRLPFFAGFLNAPDRIGYWLTHANPPGDDPAAVAARVAAFATSLADVPGQVTKTVVGVTHSPLLRAAALTFLGEDPGEPHYLHGYSIRVREGGRIDAAVFSPFQTAGVRRP